MSYQEFTDELCQPYSYWTKDHEIFMLYIMDVSFTLLMRTLR